MALTALTCPPPVRRPDRTTRPDYDVLNDAIDLYNEGQALPSLAKTFEHLFPDHEVPDLTKETFTFGQGSSRVSVRVADDTLHVIVPMVKLTDNSVTTAALRFLLQRISGSGQLYQPVLHGDEVVLEFRDRITRLHPHKVREVLRQMPFEADANDDWMVTEFQCEPLSRQPIEPLTDEEFERAHATWMAHWNECEELVTESQRKRSMFFLNEITAYAVHHIRQSLPLTGYWWSRISAAADTFNDTGYDPNLRETTMAKCCREMRAVEAASLRDSLGHATYAISPRTDGTPKALSSNLGPGDYLDTIIRLFNGGRYMDAAVALTGTYTFMLARFSWPEDVENLLLEGLAIANGTPWRESASKLLDHGRRVLAVAEGEDEDEDEEDDDDGAEDGDEDGDEDAEDGDEGEAS